MSNPNENTNARFNVDAWLAEAMPPQRAVTVYGRADLVSQLQALTAQREQDPAPATMGGHPLTSQINRVREQLAASRQVFHLRGLLFAERDALAQRFTTTATVDGEEQEKFDTAGYEAAAMAQAIVSPVLTEDQARRLHAAIGEAQWMQLVQGLEQATTEGVDVPLSRLG